MALMRLHMKFGADIFIQSGVIDTFSKIKDGDRRHLEFVGGTHGTTHEDVFMVRTPCKISVLIG